jgi:hypothetical protein
MEVTSLSPPILVNEQGEKVLRKFLSGVVTNRIIIRCSDVRSVERGKRIPAYQILHKQSLVNQNFDLLASTI